MTCQWAAVIRRDQLAAAVPLRQVPGVEVLIEGDDIWLIGTAAADDEATLLRLIFGVRPYLVAADGQLTRVGERVPSRRLPMGPRQLLRDWLQIVLPPIQVSSSQQKSVCERRAMTLVRCAVERPTAMLLSSLKEWSQYAEVAPQWRLERLVFALNGEQQVLVRGTPLPPFPAEPWTDREGICTPAGWTWSPMVEPAVLRQMLGLQAADRALLIPPGADDRPCSWQVVRETDWVQATRGAVRLTKEACRVTDVR